MGATRGLVIGAEEVSARSGSIFPDHDPFTGDLVASVAAARAVDVELAVAAADQAFTSWSQASPAERGGIFLRGQAGIDAFTTTRWITLQMVHRPFPF
ncbi:MAG TPA: aldehyde dehydrogenase family protein [Candidatus Dormibacteraeota bacterium]